MDIGCIIIVLTARKIVSVIENNFCKFEPEGQEFAKIMISLFRKIYLSSERSKIFLKQNTILTPY